MHELESEIVEYEDVRLVIQEADGLTAMRRQVLRKQAQKDLIPDDPEELKVMKIVLYPDYMGALVSSEGLPDPLPLDLFCKLPGEFLDLWGEAVYRKNGHWLDVPEDLAKKKR